MLRVIGSGSSGNAYVLRANTGEMLAIEAGVKSDLIEQGIDFRPSDVAAALVSHQHGDHACSLSYFIKNGIPTYASCETFSARKIISPFAHIAEHGKPISIGNFRVMPLDVRHDVQCYAYLIQHAEMGNLLFATDCTSVPYRFAHLEHIMIEADYDRVTLSQAVDDGTIDASRVRRIVDAHMSLADAVDNISELVEDISTLRDITLIHLSNHSADSEKFEQTVEQQLGRPCYIARKGLEIDFTLWI